MQQGEQYNSPEVAVVDLSTGQVRTLVDVNPELKNLQLQRGPTN